MTRFTAVELAAMTRPCLWCGEPVGSWCVTSSGRPSQGPHSIRIWPNQEWEQRQFAGFWLRREIRSGRMTR